MGGRRTAGRPPGERQLMDLTPQSGDLMRLSWSATSPINAVFTDDFII